MNNINESIYHVYYVECSNPKLHYNPIAIRPIINEKFATWEDTSRYTKVELKSCFLDMNENEKFPNKISIVTKQGVVLTLHELTLTLFNEKIKSHVTKSPTFSSDEEVQDFYLTHDFYDY